METISLLELFKEHKQETKEELAEIKKEIKELSRFHWKVTGGVFVAVFIIEGLQTLLHL